ncbi:TPA: PTS glucitol/sorbitol transporter subunit IIA, partial [Enterococcus faecium]
VFRKEKIMILFGDEAPETLTDYCYKIELNQVRKEITCDMKLCFDKQMYVITAVGDVVQTNLNELGHITIKFDGSHEPELPGTMYVEDKEMPHLRKGTIIKIDQEDQNGGKLYGNHA